MKKKEELNLKYKGSNSIRDNTLKQRELREWTNQNTEIIDGL